MKNHARGSKGRKGPGYRTPSLFRATERFRQADRFGRQKWADQKKDEQSFRSGA